MSNTFSSFLHSEALKEFHRPVPNPYSQMSFNKFVSTMVEVTAYYNRNPEIFVTFRIMEVCFEP
jgi:hypothetical protein